MADRIAERLTLGPAGHLIPTWGFDDHWRAWLDALGCVTHPARPDDLECVPGLAGSPAAL